MKAFYRLFYYISIVLTSILAGVTIAGAFVGNAAPDSFKFMPFIGLILPILLLANLASAIYWTIRWVLSGRQFFHFRFQDRQLHNI